MEHEVFVPVPAERLRATLADPARVARAVPGLQQDAGGEPGSGRLKVRVGSHSITYRGSVRVTAREDGAYAVEGEATEARGPGAVTFALVLRVAAADGGATLAFGGTATADGRVAELPRTAVDAAVTRLLNRFAEGLGAEEADAPEAPDEAARAGGAQPGAAAPQQPATGPAEPVRPTHPAEPVEAVASVEPEEPESESEEAVALAEPEKSAEPEASEESVEAVGSPEPGAPEKSAETEAAVAPTEPAEPEEVTAPEAPEEPEGITAPEEPEEAVAPLEPVEPVAPMDSMEPPAEAAHARRTMIGRSAEEVDHAPPRGRYAPVPAPQTIAPNPTLRWAAPAAALVVASAIVVGRALRKRR
ncbi:SRPBCC domain-containing protein [Streptomyces sp. NPDC002265]|uniref:SRPBCC domain-containing protein n=1 Tax=Streptomyces sp. NPDC002265 TaxID=3154415 RepID=UPI0033226A24